MTVQAFYSSIVKLRTLVLVGVSVGYLSVDLAVAETKRILFYAGAASHGWGSHQHPAGGLVLVQAMRRSGIDVRIDLTFEWPSRATLDGVDALVIYSDGWNVHPATDHLDDLEDFMNGGGGLSVIHWATGIGGKDLWSQKRSVTQEPVRVQWRNLVGADFEPWHSVSVIWDAGFEDLADHEITRGLRPFTVWDECYFHLRCSEVHCDHVVPLHGSLPPLNIIRPGARADSGSESALEAVGERKEPQYCSWGFERPAGGRSFGYTGGHLHWNWARDEVRMLALNGIYWTTGASVPEEGIQSPRPTAKQMLANLKGNPGWTESALQVALDRVASGEQVRWTAYGGGPLPHFGDSDQAVLEGETMKILELSGGLADPQSMAGFGQGLWEGESQLWWRDAKPGDSLVLEMEVTESGVYELGLGLTKAVDYGIFSVAVNGEPLGRPVDTYHPAGVVHTGEILLGSRALSKGAHKLRLSIEGAHPKAVKRYMVGLDYVRLQMRVAEPVSLFDEETLKGWEGAEEWWRVESGSIVGEIPDESRLARNEFLFWEGTLHDFELRMKYRISGDPSANSGVQIRSQRVGDDGAAGYQADIDDGAVWVGRIYDEHGRALISERGTKVDLSKTGEATVRPFRPAEDYQNLVRKEDWNDYIIRAVGPRIQTWINGHAASDLTDNHLGQHDYSGLLALQLHSGPGPAKIEFRDIFLTDLGETEQPEAPKNTNRKRSGISPEGRNLGFESGDFDGWTVSGDVWGEGPIEGDTVSPRRPGQASRHEGAFWVGGYERTQSDAGQGVLQSASFEVTHPWASFLVGGGSGPQTRVEIVDANSGALVFKASGQQQEDLQVVELDLRRYEGKEIFIRVVDESSGPWGHINFDDFRFHAEKKGAVPTRVESNALLQHLTPNPVTEDAHPTLAGMWVPEGFQVDLIATEPRVTQPIAFTFDERGRLWVAEAHSYPQRQPEGEGKDRVIILEDQDGDGAFETKKVFAEGLNLVSGIELGFGGVWVGAAPHLLFLPDRDGDDVLDGEPQVLLDGWGFQDTHETLNSFTWGPDGWLYGNQGVFNYSLIGRPGAKKEDRVEMRAGVWRYHPLRHEFEIFAAGCSNQWGIDFNEMGHMFITHCRSAWGGGPTSYMIQGGHYWNQANAYHASFIASGAVAWNPGKESVFRNFLPASARYGHGEGGAGDPGSRAIYGGHSHVGAMIYLGSNWPEKYRDQLFTHNLHGHQMNRQRNVRLGSGYETLHAGSDQLYTSDPMFIGVDLKYGPDGAVYMIDWVDQQHCHTTNVENWDRSNGRLYRMQWVDGYRPVKVNVREHSTAELVSMVTDSDEWFSRMARRMLQERQDQSALPLIDKALSQTTGTAEILRLLWSRHVVSGEAPPRSAFGSRSEAVRAWAVQLSLERGGLNPTRLLALAKDDPSSMVRLALASGLGRLEGSLRWRLAEALARRSEDSSDVYLPRMIWYGLAPVVLDDPSRALSIAESTSMKMLADSIYWYLAKDGEGRERLVTLLRRSGENRDRVIKLMSEALSDRNRLPAPTAWSNLAASLRTEKNRAAFDILGGVFGDESVLASMRAKAINRRATLAERIEAVEFLRESGDTKCSKEFITLLGHDDELRTMVIPLMSRFNDVGVAHALLQTLPSLDGEDRKNALFALSSQPKLAESLLDSIAEGHVGRGQLTSFHVRQMRNLGSERVNERLITVWGRAGESSATAQSTIAKYRKVYNEAPLWAHERADGEALFKLICATCHKMNGEGVAIGPDLTGSWRNGVDYFLENIVDPNVVVGESFQLHVVTLKDGTVVSGMLEQSTEQGLSIRTVTDRVNILKSRIESHEVQAQSMMPSGLLEALTEDQAIDLLKFLTTQN